MGFVTNYSFWKMQQKLFPGIFSYIMPFLSYKGPKGAIKHHFVPSGKFLFFIRFWWGFLYWIPLKERWDRYSIRFSLSPTVSEKNLTEVREKFNFSKIFISHPILMGFVANDSLWKMQQKLFPSIFSYIMPFLSYKGPKGAIKHHFVPSGIFLFFIRFWWGFFYWIPLKERWGKFSIRFSLPPTVSEKNLTEVH